ncbi:MAG: peptide chain release factor N(5)-glutamine methyltransferase [Woeseiaceae bacterium]
MYEKTPDIAGWRDYAISQLKHVSDAPRLDAERMLGAALAKPRTWLLAHDDHPLKDAEYEQLSDWLSARKDHVPLAYLLGSHEFWSLELSVTRDTLIPRPETECLVEHALALISATQQPRIADLGTGTGAIAIALAHERPNATVVATDFSEAALAIAKDNANRHGLTQIDFRHGHWCSPLANERFDLIVSNPPYVESNYPGLGDELKHEPMQALISGEDGLDDIRLLASQVASHLRPYGHILIEHGHMQAAAVSGILRAQSLNVVATHRDLSGLPRFTEATLKTT